VIALACRNLPPDLQKKGIFWGVAGAIGLRVVLTAFAASLLTLPWLKIAGALALLWIGIKLLVPEEEGGEGHEIEGSTSLMGAVKTVIIADFVMSLDNVIGVAGAAKGNMALLVFGLVVSIPLVVVGSKLILKLIERFPLVVVAGGALLGWIAGELIATDPAAAGVMQGLPSWSHFAFSAAGALLVVGVAQAIKARRASRAAAA
jgi:YjbE family integral membrane protein